MLTSLQSTPRQTGASATAKRCAKFQASRSGEPADPKESSEELTAVGRSRVSYSTYCNQARNINLKPELRFWVAMRRSRAADTTSSLLSRYRLPQHLQLIIRRLPAMSLRTTDR